MAGTFRERIEELQQQVGSGNLVMRANVHQPYAAAEHNREYYRHPRGGGPRYLQIPFEAEHGQQVEMLAASFPELTRGAIEAVGKFDDWVQNNAPVEQDVLRNSTNLYVEDNGSDVYSKPQDAPYEAWKE